MQNDFNPAITALQKRLEDLETKSRQIRFAINTLCEESGQPPMYSDDQLKSAGEAPVNVKIGHDTFFGKKLQTACREYLAIRKAQGLGPAKPREIYDALVAGGLQFESKDAEIALVGMRALLRKRYTIFAKLPNGTYGLTTWYPDLKQKPKSDKSKNEPDDSDEEATDE